MRWGGAAYLQQDKLADAFVATLNQAAAILGDSLARMTLEDARGILHGPEDAATQYFRRTSAGQIRKRFLPNVRQATDLNGYVTDKDKAMDGLFKMIAEEDRRIRKEPLARTSERLKKVFGAVVDCHCPRHMLNRWAGDVGWVCNLPGLFESNGL